MESVVPWLPRLVQGLLDRALAFDKAERFSTARAMLTALEAARAEVQTMVVLPRPPSRALPSPEAPGEPTVSTVKASPTLVARVLARRGAASPGTGGQAPRRMYALIAAGAMVLLVGGVGWFSLGETRPTPAAAPPAAAASAMATAPRPPMQEGEMTSGPSAAAPPPGTSGVALPNAPPKKRRPYTPSPSPPTAPSPADTRDPLGVRH